MRFYCKVDNFAREQRSFECTIEQLKKEIKETAWQTWKKNFEYISKNSNRTKYIMVTVFYCQFFSFFTELKTFYRLKYLEIWNKALILKTSSTSDIYMSMYLIIFILKNWYLKKLITILSKKQRFIKRADATHIHQFKTYIIHGNI